MLTLLPDPHEMRNHHRYVHYRCDCGKEIWTRARQVERGLTDNCGCVKAKQFKEYLSGEQGDIARKKALESRIKNNTARHANVKPKIPTRKPSYSIENDVEHRRWMKKVLKQKAQRESMMGRV
jgi:hypothetical protein